MPIFVRWNCICLSPESDEEQISKKRVDLTRTIREGSCLSAAPERLAAERVMHCCCCCCCSDGMNAIRDGPRAKAIAPSMKTDVTTGFKRGLQHQLPAKVFSTNNSSSDPLHHCQIYIPRHHSPPLLLCTSCLSNRHHDHIHGINQPAR